MVTICTKKFCQPTIQDIILEKIKKKKENKDNEDFFAKLKQQRDNGSQRTSSRIAVPNSTFRSLQKDDSILINQNNVNDGSGTVQSSVSLNRRSSKLSSLERSEYTVQQKEDSSMIIIKPQETSRSSAISGTNTLEELVELKNLLHKSSYVPKQTKTRRPTIEKIKSAIEKEKQILIDKNESTINESIELSDASTSTEKKRKKQVKKVKKAFNAVKTSIPSKPIETSELNKTKRRNIKKKKKINSKIDVEIQCTIYKDKSKE